MRGSPARKRTGQSPGLEKRRSPNGKSRSPEKRSSKSKDRVGAPLKPKETAVSGGLISASKRALEEAESVKDGPWMSGPGCLDRCLELAKMAPSYTFPSIGM